MKPFIPNSKIKQWSQLWIQLCNALSLPYDASPQVIADRILAGEYYRRQYLRVNATGAARLSIVEPASSSAPIADTPVTVVRTEE